MHGDFRGGAGMDRPSGRENRLNRAKVTLGNGSCEGFYARHRDELPNAKVFYSLRETQSLIERWHTVRPHSALACRPPAPESIIPIDQRPTMHEQRTTRWGKTS